MLLCKHFPGQQQSLLDHQLGLAQAHKLKVARQSINERFTPEAVRFMQALLSEQMETPPDSLAMLEPFSEVYLHDSTRFKLPAHLQNVYKGTNGDGVSAGCSIQCCYDLRNLCFKEISINSIADNDSSYAISNSWIAPGSLLLRDLGYYTMKGLQQIEQKGAFYISKVSPRTQFYTLTDEKVSLASIVEHMDKHNLCQFEKKMLITTDHKHPARVIFRRVANEVHEKRMRSRAKKNARSGSKMSKHYCAWSKLIILITNVEKEELTADQVLMTYRLRWQVELVFKTWKSHYQLHQTKKMKQERIECYLYSTLLLVTVHWKVYRWLQQALISRELYVSLYKLTKYLLQLSERFNQAVIYQKGSIPTLLSEAFSKVNLQLLTKEERKNKLSYSQIVESLCVN